MQKRSNICWKHFEIKIKIQVQDPVKYSFKLYSSSSIFFFYSWLYEINLKYHNFEQISHQMTSYLVAPPPPPVDRDVQYFGVGNILYWPIRRHQKKKNRTSFVSTPLLYCLSSARKDVCRGSEAIQKWHQVELKFV